jgi:hypothetical protein
MIEACDRLGQKLDEVAGLLKEQIEAWRQIRAPRPAARENAVQRAVEAPGTERVSTVEKTPPAPQPNHKAETRDSQQEKHAVRPSGRPVSATPPAQSPQAGQPWEQRQEAAAPLPPDAGAPAPQAAGPADDGLTAMAQGARSLVDTLSGSRPGWPEQAAAVQQALESVMAYLENQAAAAAPNLDVAGVMSRLKALEEQQQSAQSQFNNNRWGP